MPGYRKSTKTSLLILAVTAALCARVMLALFRDPEGPNLLVVGAMAAAIYAVSLAVYLSKFFPSLGGYKRVAAAIALQILVTTGLYFLLR
jgi:hypothetical protein